MSELRYAMFCEAVYGHDEDRKQMIFQVLKNQKKFFMIVSPDTTPEDYAKKKFAFYITADQILPVFLDQDSANRMAVEVDAVIDGKPGTVSSPMQTLDSLLEQYAKKNLIRGIRFYERIPFYEDIPLSKWMGEEEAVNEIPKVEDPVPVKQPQKAKSPEMVGVAKLIKMLDCQDRSKIAEYPTYSYFEKLPQLLQKLIQVNHCDMAKMDEELDLPSGVTEMTVKNPQADVSKEVLRKLLGYFGLEAYLYRYVGNCDELRRELRANEGICKFKIIPAKVSTKERFKLQEFKRAKDANGCWLYKLTFKSNEREHICIVTSPLGMIVGKEYELEGLTPRAENAGAGSVTDTVYVPQADEGNEIIQKMKEQAEKEKRAYLDVRKDYVIRYFKLQNPEGRQLQRQEAEKHYNRLAKDDDLLDEFFWKYGCPKKKMEEEIENDPEYLRRRENQPKDVQVKGYTAEKLRREFNIKPAWELYFYMADLRNMPKKTMERLRYRNTDPQYQGDKKKN